MGGAGLIPADKAMQTRAAQLCGNHADGLAAASIEYGVPVELLMACMLAESDPNNPETCVRKEPGYISDEKTPNRISAGLCQLLISTAREVMKDNSIGLAWLNNPGNSLRACAALIKRNHEKKGTDWDPIYVACAYNAGGLYENAGTRTGWRGA